MDWRRGKGAGEAESSVHVQGLPCWALGRCPPALGPCPPGGPAWPLKAAPACPHGPAKPSLGFPRIRCC